MVELTTEMSKLFMLALIFLDGLLFSHHTDGILEGRAGVSCSSLHLISDGAEIRA
jgi:hypothetical protein